MYIVIKILLALALGLLLYWLAGQGWIESSWFSWLILLLAAAGGALLYWVRSRS
jgi:hypothetical protein